MSARPPGTANCPAGGCLGTHRRTWEKGWAPPSGPLGSSPLSCLEDQTLNLFQGPQTSLTTQAPVPFTSCAANPLKPIHFTTAPSSSSLDTPNTPGPGAPHSPCPFVSSSVVPGPGPWTLAVFCPEVSPGSPQGPHSCATSPGQIPGLLPPPGSQLRGCR